MVNRYPANTIGEFRALILSLDPGERARTHVNSAERSVGLP